MRRDGRGCERAARGNREELRGREKGRIKELKEKGGL